MTSSKISISEIRINGGTQSRASIDRQVVGDYADAMTGGASFPPVVVYFDGADYWLADGFHRYEAYARAKIDTVPADVRQGTQRDAILFSVGANASHGLRRTNDDKRRAVQTLLNDSEWGQWSNREIAKACGVSEYLVRDTRPHCDKIAVSEKRTYTTKHGTQAEMNTANIGAKLKPEQEPKVARSAEPPASRVEVAASAAEPDQEIESVDPVEAKLRREFRSLSAEAQEDAYVGLSLDLQDCKAAATKAMAERDALKAQVKELSVGDTTSVIRKLQVEVKNAESARWREGEKTKDALKQVYALKKELKRLGATEIPL